MLRKLKGTPSTVKYYGFLKDDVLPVLKAKYKTFWFQQDNARPHASKTAIFFFAVNGVEVFDWPSYSPGLSPIEKIWSILKEKLYNR